MSKRCHGYYTEVTNGTSNLLVETHNWESLEDAMKFALASDERFSVKIMAWDNLKGCWHPLMKRTHLHKTPEGYKMPSRQPALVPLFGRS